jgi:hypothetical protein
MDIKGLKVFRIFLKDAHDTNKIEQYLCVAMCTERAIGLTKMHAEANGWKDFEVDQAMCLGELAILDLQYYGECEVAKCRQ